MGDKGGKKDKDKSQKQNDKKQKQKEQGKSDKQPKSKLQGWTDSAGYGLRAVFFLMEGEAGEICGLWFRETGRREHLF